MKAVNEYLLRKYELKYHPKNNCGKWIVVISAAGQTPESVL